VIHFEATTAPAGLTAKAVPIKDFHAQNFPTLRACDTL